MILKGYVDEVSILLRQNKDETFLDERYIERLINSQRVLFIKNEVNSGKTVQDSIVQTLSNIELEPIKRYNDKGESFIYLRTKKRIPKPINYKERLGIESVEIDNMIGAYLTEAREDTISFVGTSKYNSKDIYFYYKDNRIYIKVPKTNFKASLITHLNIRAVFETPTLLENYYDKEGKIQYDRYNDDYPINDAIWEYMLGEIIKKLNIPLSLKPTEENDEREVR